MHFLCIPHPPAATARPQRFVTSGLVLRFILNGQSASPFANTLLPFFIKTGAMEERKELAGIHSRASRSRRALLPPRGEDKRLSLNAVNDFSHLKVRLDNCFFPEFSPNHNPSFLSFFFSLFLHSGKSIVSSATSFLSPPTAKGVQGGRFRASNAAFHVSFYPGLVR